MIYFLIILSLLYLNFQAALGVCFTSYLQSVHGSDSSEKLSWKQPQHSKNFFIKLP